MSEETTTTKSWLERTMENIKGDATKRNVKKFGKGVVAYVKDQIRTAETKLARLESKLEDKQEAFDEYLTKVDEDRIGDTDARDSYYPRFISGIDSLSAEIDSLNEEIQDEKDLIQTRTNQLALLK